VILSSALSRDSLMLAERGLEGEAVERGVIPGMK
jgi:hypothetical protein